MEEKIPQLTLTPDLTQTPELTEKPVAELQTAPLNDQPDTRPEAGPELAQLSPEEQAAVAAFAAKIDITDTNLVLQYGAAAQKKEISHNWFYHFIFPLSVVLVTVHSICDQQLVLSSIHDFSHF